MHMYLCTYMEGGEIKMVKEDKVGRDVTDDHTDMLPSVELNGEKEHLFSCNSCEKTSKTLQGLQQHKYRYHKSEKGPE